MRLLSRKLPRRASRDHLSRRSRVALESLTFALRAPTSTTRGRLIDGDLVVESHALARAIAEKDGGTGVALEPLLRAVDLPQLLLYGFPLGFRFLLEFPSLIVLFSIAIIFVLEPLLNGLGLVERHQQHANLQAVPSRLPPGDGLLQGSIVLTGPRPARSSARASGGVGRIGRGLPRRLHSGDPLFRGLERDLLQALQLRVDVGALVEREPPAKAITTNVSSGSLTRVRRRCGSGNDAKNC